MYDHLSVGVILESVVAFVFCHVFREGTVGLSVMARSAVDTGDLVDGVKSVGRRRVGLGLREAVCDRAQVVLEEKVTSMWY